jgi:formamidopyrimidine-DNA glycosylase
MPELPDVAVYQEALERHTVGRALEKVKVLTPFLLRSYDPPLDVFAGKEVRGIRRIGKRLVMAFDGDFFLVLHLMIAGRLRWRRGGAKLGMGSKIVVATFHFPHGILYFTEAGTRKRASLTAIRGEAALKGLDPGGIDPLTAAFEDFKEALTRESHTVKRSLTDPHLFSGIGNAYSDEILHAAKLSPLKLTRSLTDEEAQRLYKATRATLASWTDILRAETGEGFPEKVTAFRTDMAVHGSSASPAPSAARRCSASSTPRTSATTARAARRAASSSPTVRSRAAQGRLAEVDRRPLMKKNRCLTPFIWLLLASPAFAATSEFKVELPADLRKMAGRGAPSPVTHALVTIHVPDELDPHAAAPILVVSATSDAPYQSSRRLAAVYAKEALPAGWIAIAADPEPAVTPADDQLPCAWRSTMRRSRCCASNGLRPLPPPWPSPVSPAAPSTPPGSRPHSHARDGRSPGSISRA